MKSLTTVRRVAPAPAAVLILCWLLMGCQPSPPQVVVYTSVDQIFSEPILEQFEATSGIEVLAVYDVEAAKTTGMVNRLIAEKEQPQADVFWNGEFAQTILLKDEGVLAPYTPSNAADTPAAYKDPDGTWTGFAGRARVLLVNTDLVPEERMPTSIQDMLDPAWSGDRLGIAYPLFGTTATQAAALYAYWSPTEGRAYFETLADREVRVVDGNSVVRDMVADGRLAFGLTDTDDACGAVARGAPVQIVIPDQAPDQMGTLIIPNTVALVAGGPNPAEGQKLIDYLISEAVSDALIASGWSHVTLDNKPIASACLQGQSIRGMDVALTEVYDQMLPAKNDMQRIFVR